MTAPRNDSPFRSGSAFESCPAATGSAAPTRRCPGYPDGAHRCRHRRDPHVRHGCLCGFDWFSMPAEAMTDSDINAVIHQPRHEARP